MLHVTVHNTPRGLRLTVGPRPGSPPMRTWRGDQAARILDRSLPGWRNLGKFSLEGGEPVRRIFLAATAETLARDSEANSEGASHDAREAEFIRPNRTSAWKSRQRFPGSPTFVIAGSSPGRHVR